MNALKQANDVLAFLLELAALATLAVWGATVGPTLVLRIVLGIAAPALMIAVWAYALAPTSTHRLAMPWLLIAKIVVFGLAVAALAAAGHPTAAIVLGVLVVVNLGLATVWGRS
ncbi:YrdB family protein [Pseudonocardia sp. GCM10023141]|uniref:YrdB family protein n=1 Tax=Pseudonocardia sp. GCM10023141 TaxID=3252653 RepID=UPI0036192DFF